MESCWKLHHTSQGAQRKTMVRNTGEEGQAEKEGLETTLVT